MINDSRSHSQDPGLRYSGAASGGITHLGDFPVEAQGVHLITGPPVCRANQTTSDESVAADRAQIAKAESARLGARRPSLEEHKVPK